MLGKSKNPKERMVRILLSKINSNTRPSDTRISNITFLDLYNLLELNNWTCCKTGIKFPMLNKGCKRYQLIEMGINPLTMPSVDRIDSSKDYTIDNIQIVCQFYNLGKTDNDDIWADEIIKLIKENE